jgi:hypothetical protein
MIDIGHLLHVRKHEGHDRSRMQIGRQGLGIFTKLVGVVTDLDAL